jgi:hypothetical protein
VCKKLTDSIEEDDENTAQGYIRAKFNRSYKTAKNLRTHLTRNGIPILRGRLYGEQSVSDVVRTSDLNKFGELIRAKERERKKAARAKASVSQENREGTLKKRSGTNPL